MDGVFWARHSKVSLYALLVPDTKCPTTTHSWGTTSFSFVYIYTSTVYQQIPLPHHDVRDHRWRGLSCIALQLGQVVVVVTLDIHRYLAVVLGVPRHRIGDDSRANPMEKGLSGSSLTPGHGWMHLLAPSRTFMFSY